MLSLPAECRDNVVYTDESGRTIANRPELASQFHPLVQISGNLFRDPVTGETFALPPLDTQPQPDVEVATPKVVTGTGPYRKVSSVLSSSYPGFSWETAHLTLGGRSSIFIAPDAEDTAYTYMGGLGANGGAVDMGFQYSTLHNNWAVFANREGYPITAWDGPRFNADQTVLAWFESPGGNQVAFTWWAIVDGATTPTSYTWVLPMDARYGWNPSGRGCTVKRVTSIAQTEERLGDGSYHRNVHWFGCSLGIWPTTLAPWNSTNFACESYPTGSPKVNVTYVNESEETDSIDLGL